MLFESAVPSATLGTKVNYGTAWGAIPGFTPELQARAVRINQSRVKRAMDIVLASALILFLLPALLVIMVMVMVDSPGPVIFRQQRYGLGKRVFLLMKFRTMSVTEGSGTFRQACAGDQRVTRVGALLRRTSLDELPQLFNVLAGHMSLVGPRPHAVPMDETYGEIVPGYRDRHLVRPGMTGLAQVCGHRGPTDSDDKIINRTECDRMYIERWSLLLDLKILLRTPAALLGPNAF